MVGSNHSNFLHHFHNNGYKKTVTFKGLEVQTQLQAFSEYISWLQQIDATGVALDAKFKVNYLIPFT